MLDIKKVYIDTRFKTEDSISHSDFFIELPRSLNVPDNTICYITDIVIPVSWHTVDARNNKLYMMMNWLGIDFYHIVVIPVKNYSGPDFAAALKLALNTFFTREEIFFDVQYNSKDTSIKIMKTQPHGVGLYMVSDHDLMSGKYWKSPLAKGTLNSMNSILRIGTYSYMLRDTTPYTAVLDLHTIRNVYLTSSSLCSYNIVSNFGNDVIIKKIAVKCSYGTMLYDSGEPGYDYLDVSKRALSRIDFKLLDSFGNVLDLRGNHWSFSLVFQTQ